jgi:hypothetical protein
MKLAMFFVLAAVSRADEDHPKYKVVRTDAQQKDSCQVAETDVALEAGLRKLGWKDATRDYPNVDFGSSRALIITTKGKKAKPTYVRPHAPAIVVDLENQANFNGTGTLVLAVSSAIRTCSTTYPAAKSEDGHLFSYDAASSDEVFHKNWVVEKEPTLPTKAPPSSQKP